MMFVVGYSNQARKFLGKVDKALAKRLLDKIARLREEPVIRDSKVVEGSKERLFRIRIGDYRILYEVDFENRWIGIVKIDKRTRAY